MRALLLLLALGVAGCAGSSLPVAPLQTPAQACEYRCTSTHAEVVAHLDALAARSALRVGTFGTSGEGRALPLAMWGADAATPQAARQTGKTRVLVIGNIHGGEVAGKDAMLELLSDLATGAHATWADSLVIAVAPIYNADGNERMEYDNRPRQDGPVEGMGQRPNAAGLDLNRDFMKVASPEARALVGLMRDLDPHVVVDLHTTNGTAMGYHLTYAPGLSPNTPVAIDADLRDRWLPSISAEILASDDFAMYHYGNVPGAFGEQAAAPRGWYSYSPQPRFSSNYAGLRGRYGILSEAYSYAPFDERVAVSRRFVEAILDRAWADASRVRQRTEAADAASVAGQLLAVRADFDALDAPVEILLGAVDTLAHPVSGATVLRRRDVRTPERMPAFVRFAPSETVRAPAAYVVSGPSAAAVRALLDVHGIQYRTGAEAGAREVFRLDSVSTAGRPFQQVAMQEAFGAWGRAASRPADPAALVVPVDQPLGRLAVALFEPRSDDGLVAWGVLREALAADTYPVERIPAR